MPKPSGNVAVNYSDLAPVNAFVAPLPPRRPDLSPETLAREEFLRYMMPEQGPPMPEAEYAEAAGFRDPAAARRTAYAKLHRELQALPEDSLMTRAGWAVGGIKNALARSIQDYLFPPQRGYLDPMAGFAPGRGALPMGQQIPLQMVAARPQALNAFVMAPHRTAASDDFINFGFVPTTDDFY